MMNSVLEYKGYHTKIEFDAESRSVRGKIEGINDFIDFESDSLERIEAEFHDAVDEYLDFCSQVGKLPDREYRGTFNVRIQPELHRAVSIRAMKEGVSLNALVERALREYVTDGECSRQMLKTSVEILTETIRNETINKYAEMSAVGSTNVLKFPEAKVRYDYNAKMEAN